MSDAATADGDIALLGALAAELARAEPSLPLYRRLMQAIEAEIRGGRLRHGQALPGERGLAEALGLSRVTVRKALDGLAASGLVSRKHGARTQVNSRLEMVLSRFTGFSDDMLSRGMTPGFRWLGRELARPTPEEARALGLAAATLVWRLARVRTADGRPIAREVSTVPARYLASPELIDGSLYRTLAARGAMPVRGVQRLRAALPDAVDQRELECDAATAILEIERRCFLASGETVEFACSRYRSDAYDFVVSFDR